MEHKPWGSAPTPAFAAMGSGRLAENRQPPRAKAYFTQLRQGIATLAFFTRSVLALRAVLRVRLPDAPLTQYAHQHFFANSGFLPPK